MSEIHIRNIDPKLYSEFKAQCALEKVSMKQVIIRLMHSYLSILTQSDFRAQLEKENECTT